MSMLIEVNRQIITTSIWIANWKSCRRAYKVKTRLRVSIISTKYKTVHEDAVDRNAYITELEIENEALRQRFETLERELQSRSPTKSRQKLRIPSLALTDIRVAAGSDSGVEALGSALSKLNSLALTDPAEARAAEKTPGKTPGKKVRKLTTRKWDLMDENDLDAFENQY